MYTVNAIVQDSNLPTLPKREQICMMIDKNTGAICGETDSLQILDEFRKLYESRIEKLDSESASEFDRMSMKCQIMTEWIKDLGEQNVMLVNTVKDLEQTATDRVKLLEEKLKQSSNIVTDKIVQSSHSEEALCLLSNRISELENDEECFHQRIEFLQSDIKGLLELIKRAHNNSWSLNDIKFYYINPSDIPSPLEYQTKVKEKNDELRKELEAKEETIKTYVSEIQNLSDKLNQRSKLANHNNIESTSVSTNSDINVQKRVNNYVTEIPKDTIQNRITIQQSKLMEEFHICTVEVQAATEDIREEINTILSSFPSQHQKYDELNKMVRDTQEKLIRMQEMVSQTINKLELQEIKRVEYTEQIKADFNQLKEVNSIQEEIKKHNVSKGTEMCTCNDLLDFVTDKVEFIGGHIQMLQNQECSFPTLTELKEHLCCTMCTLRNLQKHMNEILSQNEMEETILCEREKRLGKLEAEIDSTHTKIQDTLESLWNTTEQCDLRNHSADSQNQNQTINELLKAKEDIYKLRKEYHDFKVQMLEKTCQTKSNDKINQWKFRAIDLEDQLRILQHETKCKQEANHFLKNSIKSLENKLCSARTKAENYKHSHSIDNMDYKKTVLELENTIKIQKDVETKLQKNLDNNEIELQKSRELLKSFHAECNSEGLPMCCGYQSKHESTSQLVNELQETIQSTKNGLQDIECELKKLVSEGSCHSCTLTNLIMTVIDKVKQYEEQLDKCYEDIGNLRNTLCSKDKLLENMNQVVMIQNDSIAVTQNELKSLYKKQQEKDQLKLCTNDFQALKCKIDALTHTNICLENKYVTTKKLWQKANQELQELKQINFNKYLMDLKSKQEEVKNLQLQVDCNKSLVDKQARTIDQFQKKLHISEQQIKQFISDSTTFKERFLSVKMLLKEKSDNMAKLKADYEVLKNENTILKAENVALENKAKEDLCLLRKKLKETQAELSFMQDNYNRVTKDLKKTQENLIRSVKQEAELQESLTIAEKKFCSKLTNAEGEITRLEHIIHQLDEELSDNKEKLQSICKSFADQLETVQQDLYESREKHIKIENASCHLAQQLQECIDENYTLLQQKTLLEQDNYKFVNDLKNMYKSLMELKKECQSKDESLACMSAELSQTVINRSELCNESQYMVSCIRTWMAEQRKFGQSLASKLQMKEQQLMILKQQFGNDKK